MNGLVYGMTFRMTRKLRDALRARAKADGTSMAALLMKAVAKELGWTPTTGIVGWEPPKE